MQDQIQKLRQLNLGAYSYSSDDSLNSRSDLFQVMRTNPQSVQFIFTTPESLTQSAFSQLIKSMSHQIGLVAVDECHVIIEWGKSFRRAYRNIPVRELLPGVPIVALTASVTFDSARQITEILRLREPRVFVQSFNRTNISYLVWHKLGQVTKEVFLPQAINHFKASNQGRSVLIYTSTRQQAENLEKLLCDQGISCFFFHAGLSNSEKQTLLQQWISDEITIMIATIAFAMGIDKPNVGLVIHFCLPKSMESFYQESGRAGRDSKQSYSLVLVDSSDVNRGTVLAQKEDFHDQFSYFYLLKFLFTAECRRKQILNYFMSGIPSGRQKNCCDFCGEASFAGLFGHQDADFSEIQQGIAAQIAVLKEKVGRKYLVELDGQQCVQKPKAVSQRDAEKPNVDHQKRLEKVLKAKMGGFMLSEVPAKAGKIVEFAKKEHGEKKWEKCVAHLAQYVEQFRGAFSFDELMIRVMDWKE